jgi:4a-hydroxytetrahydrobiopterin dehydratase
MVARLPAPAIREALVHLPDWTVEGEGIERTFSFGDFAEAVSFVNRVASLAEETGHHPDIGIRWTRVRLRLTTHSCGGLTALDFDLAAGIEALA